MAPHTSNREQELPATVPALSKQPGPNLNNLTDLMMTTHQQCFCTNDIEKAKTQ